MANFLVSPLIPQQVPDFIREDHGTFVTFLQKYYEWLQTNNQVIKVTEQLQEAQDVDLATDFYINLIKKEFLPDFPETISLDKRKFIKLVSNFYSAKGTPNSVRFLFRALFDEEIEIYFPSEDILKTSDGKWVQPIVLRVSSNSVNILKIKKTLITGETSKATAIVEDVIEKIEKSSGVSYYEIFVSKVERTFQTGENIIGYYYVGTTKTSITAKIIGFVSSLTVDTNNRGAFYRGAEPSVGYTGDPVSIVGGLNPTSNVSVELATAVARVSEVSKGSIKNLYVDDGGFGFRNSLINANTSIVDFKGGFTDAPFDIEATGYISLVDTSKPRLINVSNVTILSINSAYANINVFAGTTVSNSNVDVADANSYSLNTLSSVAFTVFPLVLITVTDGGRGYRQKPNVDVFSYYLEDKAQTESTLIQTTIDPGAITATNASSNLSSLFEVGDQVRLFINNKFEEVRDVTSVTSNTLTFNESFGSFSSPVSNVSISKVLRRDLKKIGSIGRIKIVNGGTGYANGDTIIFSGGGDGYGAVANVTVNVTGTIISTSMNAHPTGDYIIGGEGYSSENLPTLSVQSGGGSGAVLEVLEICGNGETLRTDTDKIGSVLKITLDSVGYDYVSKPIVSLKNADLIIGNVTVGETFTPNVKIYQGLSPDTSTFDATVTKYFANTNILRIHEYAGTLNTAALIKTTNNVVSASVLAAPLFYGDGKAKANVEILQGTSKLSGLYLNLDGQPSADKVLQDGDKYHNFSYVLNTETPYSEFKTTLKSVVHPVGTKSFVISKSIDAKTQNLSTKDVIVYSETQLSNTFNVSYCSNVIVSTSPSTSNLMSEVSVGDFLVIKNLVKGLSGTVNIAVSSNNVVGTNTNFINDLYPNAVVSLSSGNTETVSYVVNTNNFVTINNLGVTQNNLSINVVFDGFSKVLFVNSNTIFVDSELCGNLSYGNVFVRNVTGFADDESTTADSTRIFADSTIISVDGE